MLGSNTKPLNFGNQLGSGTSPAITSLYGGNNDIFGKPIGGDANDFINAQNAQIGAGAGPTIENANLMSTPEGSWWGQQDWGMKGMGGTALGIGQLGLGVMNYMEQSKTADLQRKILGQQYESNDVLAKKKASDSASLAVAFRG